VALGAVAIFNTVTINIIERNRELATMRALGFSKLGVDMLLTIENMLGGALGILLGLGLGYLLEVELLSMFQSEMFSLDVFIAPMTYLVVGVSSLLVVLLSQAPGLRSLHRTNLALATKQRIS
jgi:putative ABC transport system permease protein